jgi:dipeptidyl aminopeptidase/acylaminoacyl peptidase
MNPRAAKVLLVVSMSVFIVDHALAGDKPKLTLDEFFNSVAFDSLELSPDGNAVVIGSERADWDRQIFRQDLWLYRKASSAGSLIQLTQSGHDRSPQWSPDGRWIAFLSDRKTEKDSSSSDDTSAGQDNSDSKDEGVDQIYLISPEGGEALIATSGEEEVHAFSWSSDSKTLYFATRNPWTKAQKDDYRKQWKDTVQYRSAERGDTIFALDVATVLSNPASGAFRKQNPGDQESDITPGARRIATSPWRLDELVTSPDGNRLAFMTSAINKRQEKFDDYEIYVLDLGAGDTKSAPGRAEPNRAEPSSETESAAPAIQARRVTHNQAVEHHLRWASDSHHIFFTVDVGDVSGAYRDLQPHLYWVDAETGSVEPWGKDFNGSVEHYAVARGEALTSLRLGTEVELYSSTRPAHGFGEVGSWPGTYELVSSAPRSTRIAFVYSSLTKPTEVYLADSAEGLDRAQPITSFNQLFAGRDLPRGKPYRWKADDGTTVEGMLIYPPGKFEAKRLPMFTLIHGGPADADGNHFEADWYQWGILAATKGWLVFEPNYRGSSGYGDKFLTEIVPVIVSRPGKDILEGVDALVKDGISDPDHLVVGGYSYGGYMTNWLITQTTRFQAAVTGAGAVEHVANWGNDDTTFDDAYFLGGRPWEAQQRYHDEAAMFQIQKVRTPTHMVAGADDIRVAVLEDYLLEHALYSLGIPNALLIFPGEGHSLDKNPWHGKIKVREELQWLEKYGGIRAAGP